VSQRFAVEGSVKIFSYREASLLFERKTKQRQLVVHGEHANTASCCTKIPAVSRGLFVILIGISEFLFMKSTICCETRKDILCKPRDPQVPGFETVYYMFRASSTSYRTRRWNCSWFRTKFFFSNSMEKI